MKDKLKELYENLKSSPSYSAKIAEFLRTHKLHSVNKRIIKKKFPRRRVIARFPNDLWMADLIEYPNLRFHNKGYKFVLLVVDCFTKRIWTVPIKKKTKELTADAMEKVLTESAPVMLVTDGGREFFNSDFQKVLVSYGISHFRTPTKTKWKASMAERAIRTIKTRIDRIMQKRKTKVWIDIIDQVVENYNNTPHSSHGFIPLQVTDENRRQVYKKLYPFSRVTVECKLQVGNRVRKLRENRV